MIVQTIKTSFDAGTKDLVNTIKLLLDYPIQPVKNTSIRSLFPDKQERIVALKPLKTSPNITKHKGISNIQGEKAQSFKKSQITILKKDPENIFEMKLKQYRDSIKKQQIINGIIPNPIGNCRTLKYTIGLGNNTVLLQHAISTRWWWSKVKIKDNNYNFIWTQLKSKKFVAQLKKHTEA
jgi:hypothetical protein